MAMEKHGEVKAGTTPELQGTFGDEKVANDDAPKTVDELADQDPRKRLADGVAEEPTT